MRLLIGYDGSASSHSAVCSLSQAGLAPTGTAKILATTATEAAKTLVRHFLPDWQISSALLIGDAADVLAAEARAWQANLIVVGSDHCGIISRLFRPSLADRLIDHAPCSLRIGRAPAIVEPAKDKMPLRALVAVDGSPASDAAVAEVKRRCWPRDVEITVVAIVDTRMLMLFGECPMVEEPPLTEGEKPTTCERRAALSAKAEFEKAGYVVNTLIEAGDPLQVLVSEAFERDVDNIFIGATGLQRVERTLLGRVGARLAAEAPCSVEIVRPPHALRRPAGEALSREGVSTNKTASNGGRS